MDLTTAKAIMNEVKRGDLYNKEIPETDGELLNDAQYYAEEAVAAYTAGWGKRNEYVVAIVNLLELADDTLVTDNSTNGEEEPLGERFPSSERTTGTQEEPYLASDNGRDGDSRPSHYLEELAWEHNLAIPQELQAPTPDMPRDITLLDDIKVRKFYSEFNALLSIAKWRLAIEMSDLNDATHLRDEAYREAYLGTNRIDKETGKAKTEKQMDLEVKSNRNYLEYEELVQRHTTAVTGLKALSDIYSSNVDRLSREMTFRQFEWEKSK